jgi:hypothetical protein
MGYPTDDPRKLLYAATRWMTAVGWAYVTFGFVIFSFLGWWAWKIALVACLLVGGVIFLIAGLSAQRHRRWAVWLGIGTSGVFSVALALLLMLLVVHLGWHGLVRFRGMAPVAVLLLVGLFVHVMIVWNLSHSLDAAGPLQAVAAEGGFEPVVAAAPRPVLPMESDDAPPPPVPS